MPALQSLVLTDRATPTPINHTFTPEDIRDGMGTVAEVNGTKIGEPRFQVRSRRVAGSGRYKVELNMYVPVVQTKTIDGISEPVVVRQSIVNCVFWFDAKSNEAERNNTVGMFSSALAPGKVLVNDALVKLEGVYGA